MRLSELCDDYRTSAVMPDPEIRGISENSRAISPGWLFVAVRGTSLDGHSFVADAIARGAAAVVVERPVDCPPSVPSVVVPSSRLALARLAARFYGHPSRDLRVIGFTGSFGKTTTSEVLRALLAEGGRRVAVRGSLGARYGAYADPGSGLTTPAPMELHRMLRDVRDRGADTAIMEVTSHALRLDRVEGIGFSDFVLTAIVPGEHTDFHRTYAEYVETKARFIQYLEPEAIVAYDADNPAARRLAARAQVQVRAGMSVGKRLGGPYDITVSNVELDERGALITVRGERLRSALLGSVNVRAVGLALAHALARDIDLRTARRVLGSLVPLPRRMQSSTIAGRTVLDDVAAHPDNFDATFEVASLLPHERLVVAAAIRGNRGADINRRNAHALADLCLLHGASLVVATASEDVVGAADHASTTEIDATRAAFAERGCDIAWEDALADAMQRVAHASSPGDLVVLVGAQGMDDGVRLLREALS